MRRGVPFSSAIGRGAGVLALAALAVACASGREAHVHAKAVETMNRAAEDYVKLVLAVGTLDPDYVDAYYGPEEWRQEVEAVPQTSSDIRSRAVALADEIAALAPEGLESDLRFRGDSLAAQLRALVAWTEVLDGTRMSFDEESKALYDAEPPHHTEEHFGGLLRQLEPLLPGDGPLVERYEVFRAEFAIPPDRLAAVFQKAIEACRERTARHIDLPDGESFEVEYVKNKPWSAYNWYRGGYESLIQVNTDLSITIDRAIDLACHEGYPGHHVYNVLLEEHLLRDRGWVEFSVYPLFSPQSLIAEGTANFGIEMAFPGAERLVFERQELFPLAGLDPEATERYYAVQKKVDALGYAGNEAARKYLNGEVDRAGAVDYLMRYALMPRERAEKRLDFLDKYRSYVINYNLGQDLVRDWIERSGGTPDNPARRWGLFEELLSTPRLPSQLAG